MTKRSSKRPELLPLLKEVRDLPQDEFSRLMDDFIASENLRERDLRNARTIAKLSAMPKSEFAAVMLQALRMAKWRGKP